MQLSESLREQLSGVVGQVENRVAECPTTEMSKLMVEIADLERGTLEVSRYKKDEEMNNPCHFFFFLKKKQCVVVRDQNQRTK